MVSLKTTALLALTTLFEATRAAYGNQTTSSTTLSQITPTSTGFLSSVQLIDAQTGTNTSDDKNHWFLIEAGVYLSANFSDELYLTVPPEFTNLPSGPFDLMDGSNVAGSVTYNSSNVFTIIPSVAGQNDRTATFNFLTKLSSSAADAITSPGNIDYTFDVSSGKPFVQTLNFAARSSTVSSTNAGVTQDSRIWYSLEVPFSEYPGSLNFAATFSDADAFKFDPSMTNVQIVTAVDGFNNPTKAVNFTGYTDNSDQYGINLNVSTQISGGRALLFKFFSEPASKNSAEIVATLRYPTLSTYKREISIIFEENVYLIPQANVGEFGETVSVMTDFQWFSTISASNSSMAAPTIMPTTSTNSSGTVSTTFTGSLSSPTTIAANGTNASANSNNTVITKSALTINGSLTYTVVTKTDSGEYDIFTSLIPVATLSSSSSGAFPTITSSSAVNSLVRTESGSKLITTTENGQETVFTSWFPVATLTSSANAVSQADTGTILTNANLPTSGVTTKFFTSQYLTSVIFTTTSNGKVIEYTSWYPVTTEWSQVSTKTPQDYTASDRNGQAITSVKSSSDIPIKSASQIDRSSSITTTGLPTKTGQAETSSGSASQSRSFAMTAGNAAEMSTLISGTVISRTNVQTPSVTVIESLLGAESTAGLLASMSSMPSPSSTISVDANNSIGTTRSVKTLTSSSMTFSIGTESVSTYKALIGSQPSGSSTPGMSSSAIFSVFDGSASQLKSGLFVLVMGFVTFWL
ncbi:LAMI_0C00562g1_1 [Lachancea mirantina]|uniref:LAMI_0C00562g1_1 n=1 Tax=Lachancea mirantina TaxID=1230905 RepID=A0A1G4IZV1_9SACH|nr:LAMI_0C00562g1_1 [Lachancea mirantina]